MPWAEVLFYILIFGIGGAILFLMSKGKIALPTYFKIEVVVLNPGCNVHRDIKPKKLPHKETIKIDDVEKIYNVKLEEMWKVKVRWFRRPINFLLGSKGQYLSIHRSSESGEPIENTDTKATPLLIRKVKKSRILEKGLNEVFARSMGGFGKFIFIFGGTLLIVYLAYQYGLIG